MLYQDLVFPLNQTSPPWDASRLGWLALASFDGFGSRTLHKLHQRFGSDGERAFGVDATTLRSLGCHEKTILRFASYRAIIDPLALQRALIREEMGLLLVDDTMYPQLLRQIADPPYALFLKGVMDIRDIAGIAVVGTRSNTPYGRRVATWLCGELARAGLEIVSGLAGGIDTIAHEAALDAGGRCVAVLGSGVDDHSLYPRCNLKLGKRILQCGGCLISEFPPGTPALKHNFPLRNRLISGMCRATIIVEAAEKSGSLITAHFALEQNRDVFAVPGPITNAQSRGTNRLLAMGAIPCTSPEEVIQHMSATRVPLKKPRVETLNTEEQALLSLLDAPRHIDDIVRAIGKPVATINALLARLELLGCIASHGPHTYVRDH